MATQFLDRLNEQEFERPPAIVCNAHITGLGVARALAAHDVPVIALDRNGDGVAPSSEAVAFAGEVTYPLDDLDGFREDVEAIAGAVEGEPVAFGCMDEWVHAFADADPEGVRLPFAEKDVIDRVLDKESLYGLAQRLGVPYPETYRIAGIGEGSPDAAEALGDPIDPEEVLDELELPFVIKPARKREFEEAVGTNVIEVGSENEYAEVIATAREADIRVMAQERVPIARGEDCSLASYVPPSGDPLTFVGNPLVRYPLAFGTSCVVERVDRPEIEERALSVLSETGYYGISESEFVYDRERKEYVLLDINTRPWKWIGLPVFAGVNLPMAAYADATDAAYEPAEITDSRWVYLPDYLELLATDESFGDVLTEGQWTALVSGAFEDGDDLATGVYSPSDPAPAYDVIRTKFGGIEYYCSC
ncbi:carboxylate--amine ligase [Halalkalicoccus sp. NIPERK01]|uniref:carboxylate--amine ligase n=1 Tax=Halalkalicoccus sp. NIPERK01 TaxID=3053469 RepID=UPI00256EF24C|nr:carboxylate--amine ligase [Halalkalicoccus sp. NIPERK01]MDL5361555.1 carboxylate--amine ligase [Halalkalicoccus sp. NIPERK01]